MTPIAPTVHNIVNQNIGIFDIGFSDLAEPLACQIWGEWCVWIGPRELKRVGECLEAARKEAGVTQAELSRRLGKPQSFMSAYETGQRRVDLLEFLVIMAALGIDAETVFSRIVKDSVSIIQSALRNK